MKTIGTRMVLTLGALLLASCGRGGVVEQPMLDKIREKAVERCEMTASTSAAISEIVARGIDIEAVCGCAVDHIMAGKTPMQLLSVTRSSPEVREAAERCAIDASLKTKP